MNQRAILRTILSSHTMNLILVPCTLIPRYTGTQTMRFRRYAEKIYEK